MGQAREEMGGLPMPHEAMGDAPGSLERMAGSVFSEEPVSGLDQQKAEVTALAPSQNNRVQNI